MFEVVADKKIFERDWPIVEKMNQSLFVFVHIPKCAGGTISRHIISKYGKEKCLDPYSERLKIAEVLKGHEFELSIKQEWLTNPYLLKRSWLTAYIKKIEKKQRQRIQCIYGHQAFFGIHENFDKNYRYFTFLREPVARFISLYNYMLTIRVTPERLRQSGIQDDEGRLRSLDEWVKEVDLAPQTMTAFLAQMYDSEDLLQLEYTPSPQDLIKVKKMLESFYFVGLTENDDDLQFVYNRLGINFYKPDKNVLRQKSDYLLPDNMHTMRELIFSKYPYEHELYEYAINLNREMRSRIKNFDKAVVHTRFRRKVSKLLSLG